MSTAHERVPRLPLITKAEFIADIGAAFRRQTGYAAGKIGTSEKHWLYYPILRARNTRPDQLKAFEMALKFHGLQQMGVFPADPEFFLRFNEFYIDHLRTLDCLGVFLVSMEPEILAFYGLNPRLIYFTDQEPDRATPANDKNCYLPHFAGKRLLLLSPFAELLKQRATVEIFEGTWSNIGKRWFRPASVEAIEFPYGFATETQARYATVLDLFAAITAEIDRRDFDVALIGAGGLGIPLASYVKRSGRIAISLGGHLQALFGVIGQRWRERQNWRRKYFNGWWIDMPARYWPQERERVSDRGAYW